MERRDNLDCGEMYPLTDVEISFGEEFIVPSSDAVQSFADISVCQPELRGNFCAENLMIYPLRFSFITPIFKGLPFLFLVQFLRRLIGICRFSWYQPGNLLYDMVHDSANSENQASFSIPNFRIIFLIRLVLYKYGYVADVPLSKLFRGLEPDVRAQDQYSEHGIPHYRPVTEDQLKFYFGWRISTICCFSNFELNYLQNLFALPMQSLVRDYQRVQLGVGVEDGEEYYEYLPVGFDGRLLEIEVTIEGREYSLQERHNLIRAHRNQAIGTAELHILQEEVQIYERRRAEGYLAEYALDVDRLGVGLSSIVEGYCRENERPFPNRPEVV